LERFRLEPGIHAGLRLLGERQDLAAILGDESAANRMRAERVDAGLAANDRFSAF
jgi:hypothetical protein